MRKRLKSPTLDLIAIQVPASAVSIAILACLPQNALGTWTTPVIVSTVSLGANLLAGRFRSKRQKPRMVYLNARSVTYMEKSELRSSHNKAPVLQTWELFSFLLPGKVQRECFEPAFNDMSLDYIRAMKFRGKWARCWINFAFTLRTIFMVADCFRVMLQSGTGRLLLGLLPEVARNWWKRQ